MAGSGCKQQPEPVYEPTTQQEAIEFAAPFKTAFDDRHKLYFKACTDHRRLAWRGVRGELTGKRLDKFTTGLRRGFYMPDYFCSDDESGFAYMNMMGPVKKSDGWAIRLRMTSEAGGVAYMDLLLEKRTDKVDTRVVVTDLYFFSIGEWVSLAVAENMDQSGLDLEDLKPEAKENLVKVAELTKLYENGEIEEAERLFADLPSRMREVKAIRLNRIFAIMNYDSTVFSDALQGFREDFPDDPSLMNLDVNGAFQFGQWDEALKAIDRMKPILGSDDGYQKYLYSCVYMEIERTEEALEMSLQSIELEPEVDLFREQLMYVLIDSKKYPEAVEELKILIEKDYPTTIDWGFADPEFYESAAFLAIKEADPERWSFLDEEWEDEVGEYEGQDSFPDFED